MDQLLPSQPLEGASQSEARRPSPRRGHRIEPSHSMNIANIAPNDNALAEARLLRLPAVQERVGMGRTAVYEMIKAGKFPRPVKVGTASAWIDVEVTRWIEQLAATRSGRS
jgi:prophage regulatory protein